MKIWILAAALGVGLLAATLGTRTEAAPRKRNPYSSFNVHGINYGAWTYNESDSSSNKSSGKLRRGKRLFRR